MTNPTIPQFTAAYSAISLDEALQLRAAANHYARGTLFADGEELIQETLLRIYERKRVWTGKVAVEEFVHGAMRSVASAARRKDRRRGERHDIDDPDVQSELDELQAPSAEEEASGRERLAILAETLAWAKRRRSGDPLGIRAVEALVNGWSAQEARRGIASTAWTYGAARRLAEREFRERLGEDFFRA